MNPSYIYGNVSSTTEIISTGLTHTTPNMDLERLGRKFDYICAPSILMSIMTITLNIFVIRFYRKTELTVVPLLYVLISAMDIVCAVGTVYQYITLGLYFHQGLQENVAFDVNAMIFFFLVQVSYRCSVFFNLLLAVSRTVMIWNPFCEINLKSVKLVSALYALPWIALFGMTTSYYCKKYFGSEGFSYFEYVIDKELLFGDGLSDFYYSYVSKSETPVYIISILPELVAFIIPVIIVIITCIIQVVSLWKASRFTTNINQRHVTTTVLLMSTLFVICNTPFTVYGAYIVFAKKIPDASHEYLIITFATLLPLVNGAFNPVILITRSCEMRRRYWDVLQKMKCEVVRRSREIGTATIASNDLELEERREN